MKTWFIGLMLVVAGHAHAWTSEGYAATMRSTIAQMDAHYKSQLQAVYANNQLEPYKKRMDASAIQGQWTAQREQVVREMSTIHAELKNYETRQINSSVKIRAKLQQTLSEIQSWRNAELARIQTLGMTTEEKSRQRLQINQASDARTRQIQASALVQEDALRKLNQRADRPMFSTSQESSFALKHRR